MRIKIQYLGPFRALLNKREEEVNTPVKATIQELLMRLSKTYGKAFENEIFEDNGQSLREGLVVTVNGTAIWQLNGLETGLKLGDVVSLLPIFVGGG